MRALFLQLLCSIAVIAQVPQGVAGGGSTGRPSAPNAPPVAEVAPVKPEERCVVEGTVISAATGEPLKKTNLTLRKDLSQSSMGPMGMMPGISYSGTTDAAGHFSIPDVEPGKYRLSAERVGYVSQQYGAKGPSQAGTVLSLEKSQKLKDASFKLTPQGIVTGRVLDEDGDPVINVSLQLLRSAYLRGRKQLIPAQGAMTNDLGEYRIHSLPPGRYILSAVYRAGGFMMEARQNTNDESYAPTYYPSAPTPEAAVPIEVTAGAQLRGMDIRLQKTKTVRISGRVTIAGTGKAARNVNIMLAPKGDIVANFMMQNMSRPYNAEGDFMMANVAPGSYVLAADSAEDWQAGFRPRDG